MPIDYTLDCLLIVHWLTAASKGYREPYILKLIGRSHVVSTFYGVCQDFDNLYIAMEMVPGGGVSLVPMH